jgi:5-methylcytosine-specific restriction endonuclease McrBC regulatory subunit McrC
VTAGLPFEVFRIDQGGLRVCGAVGLLEVGGLQLELRPKVELAPNEDPARFLMDLLWKSGISPRLFPRAARTAVVADSIPEALIQAFADDLLQRLRWGPPRRYHQRIEESQVVRGRVDFGRLATRAPGRDQFVPVRYAPLQGDNPLAQVIKATSVRMLGLGRSARSRRMLHACVAQLPQADLVPLTAALVDRVRLTRFESDWHPVLAFARALVRNQAMSPVAGGGDPAVSLLFSLEDVFEGVLRLAIPQALAPTPFVLQHRPSRLRLLKHDDSGRELLQLRPDYVFASQSGERVAVGDAKWKRLVNRGPGFGLRSSDAYQLTTYMARHGLANGILLFPWQPWMPVGWAETYRLVGGPGRLRLVGADIAGLVSRSVERRDAALGALQGALVAAIRDGEGA